MRFINSRNNSSSSFFTNLPFTLSRESAKFFRTSYFTFFVHTRCFLFSKNRWTRFFLASGLYIPIYFFCVSPCVLIGVSPAGAGLRSALHSLTALLPPVCPSEDSVSVLVSMRTSPESSSSSIDCVRSSSPCRSPVPPRNSDCGGNCAESR